MFNKWLLINVTACPEGMWGQDCKETCRCHSASICDPTDGSCSCGLGWTGYECNKRCETGMYGPDCKHTCECQNGAVCDMITGCCTCTSGWYGQTCDLGKFYVFMVFSLVNLINVPKIYNGLQCNDFDMRLF